MARGKSVGEYSAKSTSATLSPGPGGSTITAINFEGTGNLAGLGSATIIGTGGGFGFSQNVLTGGGSPGYGTGGDLNFGGSYGEWSLIASLGSPGGVAALIGGRNGWAGNGVGYIATNYGAGGGGAGSGGANNGGQGGTGFVMIEWIA